MSFCEKWIASISKETFSSLKTKGCSHIRDCKIENFLKPESNDNPIPEIKKYKVEPIIHVAVLLNDLLDTFIFNQKIDQKWWRDKDFSKIMFWKKRFKK